MTQPIKLVVVADNKYIKPDAPSLEEVRALRNLKAAIKKWEREHPNKEPSDVG